MRGLGCGVLAMLAGCLEPSNVLQCGDKIFPAGQLCMDGAAAGSACTIGDNMAPGRCLDCGGPLVCQQAVCGDGIVDDALKEQCDGTASFDHQCADVGFDLGLLGCDNQRCELDTTSCVRFGWGDPIVTEPIVAMWADDQVIAYARSNPPSLHVTGGGYNVDVPGQFVQIAGGGGRIVVVGNSDVFQVEKQGTLTSLAFTPQTDRLVVTVDDAGTVYAIPDCTGNTTQVSRYTDAAHWQLVTNNVTCPQLEAVHFQIAVSSAASGHRLFMANHLGVFEVDVHASNESQPPQSIVFPFANPMFQLTVHSTVGGEALFGASNAGLGWMPLDGSATKGIAVLSEPVRSIAFTRSSVFAMIDSTSTPAKRITGGFGPGSETIDVLAPPTNLITDDGHDGVYAYGGSIYLYLGNTFGELEPPDLVQDDPVVAGLEVVRGAPLFASENKLLTVDDVTNTWSYPAPPIAGQLHALGGLTKDHYAVSAYSDDGSFNPAVRYIDPPVNCDMSPAGIETHIDGLWMSSTGTLVFAAGFNATTSAGFLRRWVRGTGTGGCGTWDAQDALPLDNCSAHGVTGRDPMNVIDVVAVGECMGHAQIWNYHQDSAGAAWSAGDNFPDIGGPFYGVKTFANGEIFAVGDDGLAWFDGQTWKTEPTVTGRSISGTSATDVWIAGALTPIRHWDGSSWSNMTTTWQQGQTAVVATANRVVMPGSGKHHVSLLRDPQPHHH